jgi:electron transport complex protein RnfG
MSPVRRNSPPRHGRTHGGILFVFVIIFTGLLSAAYLWTKPAIEASAAEEKMKLVDEVLPRANTTTRCSEDLTLPPTPELGLAETIALYRARKGGQPVGAGFEAVAPDGYAGKIKLLVAIRADGQVAGVRVTQHKETPGLGDYIEVKKDKNKARPWITQFTGMSLARCRQGLEGQEGWRPHRLLRRRNRHPARRVQGRIQGRPMGRGQPRPAVCRRSRPK